MTLHAVHPSVEPIPILRGLDPALVMAAYPDIALIYLLHLDTPFVVNGYAWQHYCGSSGPGKLASRQIAHHLGTSGVRFLQLASAAGCTWHLARVWPLPPGRKRYDEEQRIKAMGGFRRSCPSCGIIPKSEAPRDALGRYAKHPRRTA